MAYDGYSCCTIPSYMINELKPRTSEVT